MLAYDRAPLPTLELDNLSITEARVFEKLATAKFINVVINRLDSRGADLSNVLFENVVVTSLIVDETTRFGTTLPTVSILQNDKDGRLNAEHSPTSILMWLMNHSAQSDSISTDSIATHRELPLIKLFERLCRRFMRQHVIRDSDRDEGSFLLRDQNWPLLREILKKHQRLEEETRPAAGTADVFYRLKGPEILLYPNGDASADVIRDEILKAAISASR
jgi:hypothetical protein